MSIAEVTVAAPASDPSPDVGKLARELLAKHGNISEAATELEEMCDEDAVLYRAVVNGHMRALCSEIIGKVCRVDRRASFSAPPIKTLSAVRMAALADAVESTLMDGFRLPGGKALGDATKPDLIMAANGYAAQIGDMMIKRRWLSLIADKMKDDRQTVRTELNEQTLQALKAEAKNLREAA